MRTSPARPFPGTASHSPLSVRQDPFSGRSSMDAPFCHLAKYFSPSRPGNLEKFFMPDSSHFPSPLRRAETEGRSGNPTAPGIPHNILSSLHFFDPPSLTNGASWGRRQHGEEGSGKRTVLWHPSCSFRTNPNETSIDACAIFRGQERHDDREGPSRIEARFQMASLARDPPLVLHAPGPSGRVQGTDVRSNRHSEERRPLDIRRDPHEPPVP